ncbi:hypothetical protein OE699_05855 [Sedimentimonas flavescens]|uniref:Uncharacterized protein n=1 Tax=Sedimentimonas flavescens TaxID=2851012 RepID=A0ABT2ZXN7_9RHOB|nr:hypothetical protein [Sedimentimonas flavescens]MBW0157136.1 hypothetical protein [Sedimentimonas flavescens]MCT2538403.1 hypothetical protein [Sedimentimonas flavescens]MCV2878372.1 hypothetical protein [Sedimentimonas flavescens]WBL34552.1 hypothetical protein O5O51_07585 [Sinirhodobacter sp. HNIBRBA609]
MLLDPQSPALRALWVRILIAAVPLLAAAASFRTGYVFLGAFFAIVSGWVFRRLFLP